MKNITKTFLISFLLGLFFLGLGPIIYQVGGFSASAIFVVAILFAGWILCHKFSWISNPPQTPWIDMGWALFASMLGWAWFRFNALPTAAFPTLMLFFAGALGGGFAAYLLGVILQRKNDATSNNPEA